MYVRVAHLPLEDGGARVAVGRSLFKAVILFHRLIVEVFSIHHEQHLVDIRQAGRQLRCLKGGQRLAAAGCVPDIAACFNRTALLVGRRNLDAVEDALRRGDLIGAHHQQKVFRRKHAVASQDIQQRVLGKNVLVKSTRSGMTLLLASAQKEVNSKLLLVFLLLFRPSLISLMWLLRVVLE